jgi:GNAT superfamily N-acetyltransferase
MRIRHLDEAAFCGDFLPLIAELECGDHYEPANSQHVDWLRNRVRLLFAAGGTAICLYSDDGEPMGFIFVVHDKGLEGVNCFGKKATAAMFGLFKEYRSQGLGGKLLQEAERHSGGQGAEFLYVETYAGNTDGVRWYLKHGFFPVAYHPGENGLGDKGQVYLRKELAAAAWALER